MNGDKIEKKEKLYIVMPAYNEEKNIAMVIRQWYPLLKLGSEDSKLIVADAGSIDNTHQILLTLQHRYPKLEILTTLKKEHSPKVISLYDYSIKKGADWIFQTDSDGQTDPDNFIEFWNDRRKYDAIIGNRKSRKDGLSRIIIEKTVCFLLKIYFGINVPDANAPFRLMKSDLVKKYLYKLPENYDLPNIMMTAYFVYNKEHYSFKEISFIQRSAGVSSVNISKIIKLGLKSLSDFKSFKQKMKIE